MDDTTKWRWGAPLSRAEAEAIARRYAEGHDLTPMQREERLQAWFEDQMTDLGYPVLDDVRGYMKERGITRMEADVDHNLLEHTKCEDQCAQEFGHLTGPELDHAFWGCMDRCSPMRRENYNPDAQPASEVEQDKLSTTTLHLPSRYTRK